MDAGGASSAGGDGADGAPDVTSILQAIQQALQQSASQQKSEAEKAIDKVLKDTKREVFTGENTTGDDADAWLRGVEFYFDLIKAQDSVKALLALAMLGGFARVWWETCLIDLGKTPVQATWADFKTAFEGHFTPPGYNVEKMNEFFDCVQTGTVADYNERFRRLQPHCPAMDKVKLCSRFVKGLHVDIKSTMSGVAYKDLEEVVRIAKSRETDLAEKAALETQRKRQAPSSWPVENLYGRRRPFRGDQSASPSVEVQSNNMRNRASSSQIEGSKLPPRLTDEERQRCFEEGRCFRCRATGHTRNNCPVFGSIEGCSSSMPMDSQQLDRSAMGAERSNQYPNAGRGRGHGEPRSNQRERPPEERWGTYDRIIEQRQPSGEARAAAVMDLPQHQMVVYAAEAPRDGAQGASVVQIQGKGVPCNEAASDIAHECFRHSYSTYVISPPVYYVRANYK